MKQTQEKQSEKVKFTISLPKDLYDRLEGHCHRTRKSKAFQIFLLVEDFFKQLDDKDRQK